MAIPKEYFNLVEEVRDDVIVIDDDTDYIPSSDVNECAINYMDTLTMERCEPEQHTLELRPMDEEELEIRLKKAEELEFELVSDSKG